MGEKKDAPAKYERELAEVIAIAERLGGSIYAERNASTAADRVALLVLARHIWLDANT